MSPRFDPELLLMEVNGLTVEFDTQDGTVHAVTDVSYRLHQGETLAILGESGSGKSVSVQAIMGLIPTPPGRIAAGSVMFQGLDLITAPRSEVRQLLGSEIAMIFQDPLSSLNPVFPVGWQIGEALRVKDGLSRKDARARSIDLMDRVHIPNARKRVRDYPHEFSGGMRQRAMIAMALAQDPKVLIADEPTTALDVTVQAQIMDLLEEIQRESQMGLILITHDLGVVASVADSVLVMYGGRIIERATADDFYAEPAHPYSQGLLASVPRLLSDFGRLQPIDGAPPSLIHLPPGCSFSPRCPHVAPECLIDRPHLVEVPTRPGLAACFRMGQF